MTRVARLAAAALAVALPPRLARAEGPPPQSIQVYCVPGSLNNCYAFAITDTDGHITFWFQNLQGSLASDGAEFDLTSIGVSTILGGGMRSRLFQNVREKHGLAYSVFSELNLYRDSGCLAVYAGTSPETLKKVILMVVDEFRQLCGETVPAEELRRAKDHLKGSLALSLESTSARMSNLARQELFFGRFQSVDEMMEGIEQVDASQVQTIANDFFSGKQVGVTGLGRVTGIELASSDVVV